MDTENTSKKAETQTSVSRDKAEHDPGARISRVSDSDSVNKPECKSLSPKDNEGKVDVNAFFGEK